MRSGPPPAAYSAPVMLVVPESHGPSDPRPPAPALAPGSVRRTTSLDSHRPGALLGPAVTDARARDCIGEDTGIRVLAVAVVRLALDGFGHRITELVADPPLPPLTGLVGQVVGPGFRRRVDDATGLAGSGDLRYALLDDLPGAVLVSGYALLHADVVTGAPGEASEQAVAEHLAQRADLCAGWAADGTMLRLIGEHGRSPVPLGPPAPPLDTVPDAFHAVAPLVAHATRRVRRIDVHPAEGGSHRVVAFFRDSHLDDSGAETVVHEYSLEATVDGADRTVTTIDVQPDVLPWIECPGALASAQRLVGQRFDDLRAFVRRELSGVTTCTHLNDSLRSLADVDHLIGLTVRPGV